MNCANPLDKNSSASECCEEMFELQSSAQRRENVLTFLIKREVFPIQRRKSSQTYVHLPDIEKTKSPIPCANPSCNIDFVYKKLTRRGGGQKSNNSDFGHTHQIGNDDNFLDNHVCDFCSGLFCQNHISTMIRHGQHLCFNCCDQDNNNPDESTTTISPFASLNSSSASEEDSSSQFNDDSSSEHE